MKTILRTLICTALCCAAWSAFAGGPPPTPPPGPNGSTSISFKDPTCTAAISSVDLSVPDVNPDVCVVTNTTSSVGQPYIDQGKVQLEIATDGLGNPVPASYPTITWVRIDTFAGGGQNPTGGLCTFPVNLDDLSAFGLNPVTCAMTSVGFRAHYITGGGPIHVDTHFSPGTGLAISCGECGTSPTVSISAVQSGGPGNPVPGQCADFAFTITVQNCTANALTNIKVQGGTNGWCTFNGATPSYGTYEVRNNNRNQIVIWTIPDLSVGQTETIQVFIHGCVKHSQICTPCDLIDTPVPGSIMYLSGPWSAAYVDPVTNLPTKSDYTDRVSIEVTCTVCP